MQPFKFAYQFKVINALIDKLNKIFFPDKACKEF